MLSLSILIVLAIALFSITYFCKGIESLPSFRKANLKGSIAFVLAIFFFVFNLPTIGTPLILLSMWMTFISSGMNIRGLKCLARALPSAKSKNHAQVISICDEALNGDTRAPALFAMGAESAIFMNQFEKSLAFSNRLVLLTSSEPRGYFLRGIAQYQMGNFEQSLHDINQAISLESKQSDAFKLERARTKFALQDYSGALEDLNTFASSTFCKEEFKGIVDTLHSDCLLAMKDKSD